MILFDAGLRTDKDYVGLYSCCCTSPDLKKSCKKGNHDFRCLRFKIDGEVRNLIVCGCNKKINTETWAFCFEQEVKQSDYSYSIFKRLKILSS